MTFAFQWYNDVYYETNMEPGSQYDARARGNVTGNRIIAATTSLKLCVHNLYNYRTTLFCASQT